MNINHGKRENTLKTEAFEMKLLRKTTKIQNIQDNNIVKRKMLLVHCSFTAEKSS